MKLKLIALATLMAVAGSAHAVIDPGVSISGSVASGNGSLLLNLKWRESPVVDANDSVSATFDLGINLDDVATWGGAGFTRSWNLNTGVMSGTGIAPTALGTYGSAFDNFLTAGVYPTSAAMEMSVFALDGTGAGDGPGNVRILTTANQINATGTKLTLANSQTPTNANFNNIPGNIQVTNYLAALNNTAAHQGVANGANNATASDGYAWFDHLTGMDKLGNLTVFDTTGQFEGNYAAGTGILSGQDKALPFYKMVASSNTGSEKVILTPFGFDMDSDGEIEFDNNASFAGGANEYGLWTLDSTTGTLMFANPVPEAETYAMMLAGLGLVGFLARRRKTV